MTLVGLTAQVRHERIPMLLCNILRGSNLVEKQISTFQYIHAVTDLNSQYSRERQNICLLYKQIFGAHQLPLLFRFEIIPRLKEHIQEASLSQKNTTNGVLGGARVHLRLLSAAAPGGAVLFLFQHHALFFFFFRPRPPRGVMLVHQFALRRRSNP